MIPASSISTKSKLESQELLKISRFKPLIKKTIPHKHEGYFELIYIAEGEGFHWIETENFQIQTPDFYFLKPGQLHFWQFTAIPKGYVMMFKEEFIDAVKEVKILQQMQQMGELTRISNWQDPMVRHIFEDILQVYKSDTKNTEDVIKGYLRVLFAKISEHTADKTTSIENPLCDRFLSLLSQQSPILHKVVDYATILQTTPQNLNQACKKKTGKTASDHINSQLILEAKRNILHTDQNINQIADLLQFNDASYFVKFFKKHTGETPHQFRGRYFG
ncbi:AraC family transcriptional regulator [Arthrospiribacter ruber]|uniref:Helix-turn-helix domain-containing protein n=1 Tax=Arthrospiribacter ruber TaxID=2487934 RepID=A0A951MCA4_9BACT|nr:AraC family transcriptional regulator [Arthrospiribacter ruber]MBW3469136.1 helix-turn-helix domain-containing protein [Arthrospiribacter ruber]